MGQLCTAAWSAGGNTWLLLVESTAIFIWSSAAQNLAVSSPALGFQVLQRLAFVLIRLLPFSVGRGLVQYTWNGALTSPVKLLSVQVHLTWC